jgi:hypothetical protein
MSIDSLAQSLQSTGIEAFGLAMPVLAQDWGASSGATYTLDEPTMALTISGVNWAAPLATALLVVNPQQGTPPPITLSNADGTIQTGAGLLLTVFEAAWLRLGRLYAKVLESSSTSRPEQSKGLPLRQVPRYFFYPTQPPTSQITQGIVGPGVDLGFMGALRIYDNDGLPIDPVSVMSAFNALMGQITLLQAGTPTEQGNQTALGDAVNKLTSNNDTSNNDTSNSETRVRIITPDGAPYSGTALTGLTAVSAAAGAGISTVTSGTPVAVQQTSTEFTQDDRNRVVIGPATSGRLTDSFTPPTLPSGVSLPRDFFTLRLVTLKTYLLGTPAQTDPATQSQGWPDVRINENPTLLASGNDVLGSIQAALGSSANPTLAVAQTLDGGFTLPTSAGTAAHWPKFPTGITVDAATDTPPVTLPASLTVTAAYVNTAATDFTKADVVVTLSGWPTVTANAWVRVYTRLFGVNAVQQRGDGQGRLVPTSGPLSIYLTDPLGLRQPGLNPGQIVVPPDATLNFDMAVVLPNGNTRIYGGLAAKIAAGPTPPPTLSLGTNPTTASGCLQGVSTAGVLGLNQPAATSPPTSLLGWVEALTGEGNPRNASRFPTMARRELLVAGFASSKWSGVIGGGRIAHETVSDQSRIGAPGSLGGRETTVTGAATSGGRLAYDIARHALRRAQNIGERVVTLAGSAWALPAEPTAVTVGQQASGASGTFAGAALQNIAPYCESPEMYDVLATKPNLIDQAIDWIVNNTTILPDALPDKQDIVNALNSLKATPPAGTPTPSNTALIIAAELIRELSSSAFGRRDSQWALANAITSARHFIYIETPGFCSTADRSQATPPPYALDLIAKLATQLQNRPGLRLMICCPKYPDFAPGYEGMASYEVQDRYNIVLGNPVQAVASQLPTAQTVAFHPIGFPGRYSRIETNLVIVDDSWMLQGGSTFRRRGLTFDGSSDLVLADTQLENGRSPAIRDFRRALLAARLGVPTDQEHPSYVQLFDGQRAFSLIRQTLQGGGLGKIDLWWNGQTPGMTAATPLPIAQANPDGRDFDAATAELVALLAASSSGW